MHGGDHGAQYKVMNPLKEIHVIGVRSEEDWSHGERGRVAGHSDIAQIVANCVHVHEGRLCRVDERESTIWVRPVQDKQIKLTVQQFLGLVVRQHRIAGLERRTVRVMNLLYLYTYFVSVSATNLLRLDTEWHPRH